MGYKGLYSRNYTIVDGLTSLGMYKYSLSLSLFRKILFLMFTLVLPIYFGAKGAFYAEPAADIIGGIVSTTVFSLIINKILARREEMPDGEPLYG
jgi:Na+-driven multidrug efflux pump